MKRTVFTFAALAAAVLVMTFGVPSIHAAADPEALLGNVWSSSESHEVIGTGSMTESSHDDSAAVADDREYSLEEGASIGPHNVLGTGSMLPETGNAPEAGISGQGGLTRPDVDFP